MVRLPFYRAHSFTKWKTCRRLFEDLNSSTTTCLTPRGRCRQFSAAATQHTSDTETSASSALTSRGLLRLAGPDTPGLLQGLVTSDIGLLMERAPNVQYCMMLNVQGRVLYDLFLYNMSHELASPLTVLVDVDTSVKAELHKLFKKYKLRKKVDISDVSDERQVVAHWGREKKTVRQEHTSCSFHDPRVPMFGSRAVVPAVGSHDSRSLEEASYVLRRYQWGIPEGVNDLPPGVCLPLESNLVLMNGVSFQKGCYIGQELTARTFHTGVTRKRIMPIVLERDAAIEVDTTIKTAKGKNAGKFRSASGCHGLGLMRLAHIKDSLSVIGQDGQGTALSVQIPSWWPPSVVDSNS